MSLPLLITDLPTLTGTDVAVATDVIPIVDVSNGPNGKASKITVKELIANTSSFVQSGTGAQAETVAGYLGRQPIPLTSFMTDAQRADVTSGTGAVDVTAAVQAVFDLLDADNLAEAQRAIYMPAGKYLISSTITTPNPCSYFKMFGDGGNASKFKWNGAAGSPVLKFINARGIQLADFGVEGKATAKPSYLLQFNQQTGHTVGTGYNKLCNLKLGGTSADHETGIGLTHTSDDTNNEQFFFEELEINNSNGYCYEFLHSNSLLHMIVGGSCSSFIGGAINTYVPAETWGASFAVFGTRFSGGDADSILFNLMQPRFTIEIFGAKNEGSGKYILKTNGTWNTGTAGVAFYGGQFGMTDPGVGENNIDWDVDSATLSFFGTSVFSANGIRASYQGTGQVLMCGGAWTHAELRYDTQVRWIDIRETAGDPTYTNLGSGTLLVVPTLSVTSLKTGLGFLSFYQTYTALTSGEVSGPLGTSMYFLIRDVSNGGTALVLYENASTPVIIAQNAGSATTFVVAAPGAAEIQIKNLAAGSGGVGFVAGSSRNNTSLRVSMIQTQA